ncbi:MAG: DUF554 domain-containing protein [Treponema sp.]|nr:DUF554 domain-containing protein [Treponema sp.]
MGAVFINCAAVIVGSLIGVLLSRRMTEAYTDAVQTAAGVVSMVLGMQMAFSYENVVYLALSLLAGGLLGTWWNIDGAVMQLGSFLERLVYRKKQSPERQDDRAFAAAFLNASVLFCVGAMAIIGSFKAAIEHDYTIISTKSVLDGFMALTFSAAMGIGTAFSALVILVYQGALTLLAIAVQPFVSETLIHELTGVGGVLIILIGINLAKVRHIKTANFLPAMLVMVVLVCTESFFKARLSL